MFAFCSFDLVTYTCFWVTHVHHKLQPIVCQVPMVWTIEDIEKEIKDLSSLYALRGANEAATDALSEGMAKAVVSKINSIADLTCGDAVKVLQTLDTVTLPIQKGVEGKLETKENVAAPPSISPQTISLSHYLSESDCASLQSAQVPYHGKLQVVVKRLKSLGLVNMSEKTVKHAVRCILSGMTSVPAAGIIYQIVCDLREAFAGTPVRPGLPFVEVYPDDPEALPKNYMEDAPLKWQPPSLCTLLQSDTIPPRKTQKSIGQQNKLATPSINCQPANASVQPQDLCQVMMQGMQGMMNMFGQMAGNIAGHNQHQASKMALPSEPTTNTPAVQVLKPKHEDEPKQQLALEPPAPLK